MDDRPNTYKSVPTGVSVRGSDSLYGIVFRKSLVRKACCTKTQDVAGWVLVCHRRSEQALCDTVRRKRCRRCQRSCAIVSDFERRIRRYFCPGPRSVHQLRYLISACRAADVSVFEGWIVTMDSVCHATDIPSAARGSTEGSTVAAYTTTDKPAQCTARGQVVKFHAPRATRKLMPLNCSTASASTGSRHALCHLNPDPTPQQNCLEPSKTARTAERVGPIPSAAKRSGASATTVCMPALMWQDWAASVQMAISFVFSSALEKFLGQKTRTLKVVAPRRYSMYLMACLVHDTWTSCKLERFLIALQAAAVCNNPAQPAIKQRQPPQACNHVSKAAGQQLPLPHPSSAWEQFIDAEAETSQAAAEADSSQKSLTQSHITGVMCRHGLQSQSLASSGPVSKVLQQAQHGTSRCGSLPQAEPTYTLGSQQSHAGAQPSNEEHKPNTTPAATACKPLVPIFSKHKQHVFKPPAMMPANHGNSQCKAPSQQTSSSVQGSQDASNKPAIVFDELHAVARHIAVPTSFACLRSYQQIWCDAVTEEVNIRCALIPHLLATLLWPKINIT